MLDQRPHPIPSPTRSPTYSLPHPLTCSPTHTHSPTYSSTQTHIHSHSLTHSPTHTLTGVSLVKRARRCWACSGVWQTLLSRTSSYNLASAYPGEMQVALEPSGTWRWPLYTGLAWPEDTMCHHHPAWPRGPWVWMERLGTHRGYP